MCKDFNLGCTIEFRDHDGKFKSGRVVAQSLDWLVVDVAGEAFYLQQFQCRVIGND